MVRVVTTCGKQHFKCCRFGITVLPVSGKYVMIRGDTAEEVGFDVSIAAMMWNLQDIDVQMAVGIQQLRFV